MGSKYIISIMHNMYIGGQSIRMESDHFLLIPDWVIMGVTMNGWGIFFTWHHMQMQIPGCPWHLHLSGFIREVTEMEPPRIKSLSPLISFRRSWIGMTRDTGMDMGQYSRGSSLSWNVVILINWIRESWAGRHRGWKVSSSSRRRHGHDGISVNGPWRLKASEVSQGDTMESRLAQQRQPWYPLGSPTVFQVLFEVGTRHRYCTRGSKRGIGKVSLLS